MRNQIENLKEIRKSFNEVGGKKRKMDIIKQLVSTYEANVSGWLLNRIEDPERTDTLTSSIDNSNLGPAVIELVTYKEQIENLITSYAMTLDRKDEMVDFLKELDRKYATANKQGEKVKFDLLRVMINAKELLKIAEGLTPNKAAKCMA